MRNLSETVSLLKQNKLERLRSFDMDNYLNFSLEDYQYLFEALEHNTSVTYLDLHYCRLGEEGFSVLVNMLNKNKSITHLNISDTECNDKALCQLASILNQTQIKGLYFLYGNNITDASMHPLGEALESNTVLEELWLSNNIKDDGAKAIAAALKKNNTLRYLNLSSSLITDEGAQAMIEVLLTNHSLQTLEFYNWNISYDTANKLLDILINSFTLATLDVNKPVHPDLIEKFKQWSKINRSLATLISYDNQHGFDQALSEAMKFEYSDALFKWGEYYYALFKQEKDVSQLQKSLHIYQKISQGHPDSLKANQIIIEICFDILSNKTHQKVLSDSDRDQFEKAAFHSALSLKKMGQLDVSNYPGLLLHKWRGLTGNKDSNNKYILDPDLDVDTIFNLAKHEKDARKESNQLQLKLQKMEQNVAILQKQMDLDAVLRQQQKDQIEKLQKELNELKQKEMPVKSKLRFI